MDAVSAPRPSASSSTTSKVGRCTHDRPPTSALPAAAHRRPRGRAGAGAAAAPGGHAGQPASDPARGAWVTVAFTYQGLKALGVPQESLDSFAPEFQQGMAARAAELGDVGDSSPATGKGRSEPRCPRRAGGAVA